MQPNWFNSLLLAAAVDLSSVFDPSPEGALGSSSAVARNVFTCVSKNLSLEHNGLVFTLHHVLQEILRH